MPGSIDHPHPATGNLLDQFVFAKIPYSLGRAVCLFSEGAFRNRPHSTRGRKRGSLDCGVVRQAAGGVDRATQIRVGLPWRQLHLGARFLGGRWTLAGSRFCAICAAWILGYLTGVAGVALLLAYEQSLVRADDLSRVKQAFDLNGYVGFLYLTMTAAALYVR